jgi:HEAT repeat protein
MTSQEIDDLFARALYGEYEDDSPWEAVSTLRRIGSREVFDRAVEWSKSEDSLVRARGIDVLAQLGRTAEHPTNNFPDESYLLVSRLLQKESELQPLSSAISALGHINNPLAIPLITRHSRHPSAEIRFSVACALGSFALLNDPRAVETLLALMEDTDDDVRDWATFGLGVLSDSDSAEIRDALFRRTSDSNEDVQEEAMVGLGKRRDPRVLLPLITALEQPSMTDRVIEAAYLILEMKEDRKDWKGRDYVKALRQRFAL